MPRFIAAAAATLLVAGSALAQSSGEVTGFVRYVDRDARVILLDSNDFVRVPDSVDMATLAVGNRLTVSYEAPAAGSTQLNATAITHIGQ